MEETKTVDLTEMISQRRMKAKADLRKENLQVPRRPGYDLPRLPLNLTELNDDGVMQLLVQFTRYHDHISGQLASAEIDEQAADHILEVAKAQHLVKGWSGTGDRVAVAKAEALLDKEVQAKTEAHAVIKARRKLLGVLVESLSRDAGVVSREITRRVGRENFERRADRYTA